MNKSQKETMVVLILSMILLLFSITLAIAWFSYEPILEIPPLFFFMLTFLVMGLSVILLRRKQSPSEVDYDERDVAIKQKAIFASYITLWILVFTLSTAWVVNAEHGIFAKPDVQKMVMFSPPIVVFLMYLIVKIVYSLTILTQYGRGGKHGE